MEPALAPDARAAGDPARVRPASHASARFVAVVASALAFSPSMPCVEPERGPRVPTREDFGEPPMRPGEGPPFNRTREAARRTRLSVHESESPR